MHPTPAAANNTCSPHGVHCSSCSGIIYSKLYGDRHMFRYLAVYFVAVFRGAHLDELAIDSLEDVEDVSHQRCLAHLPCRRVRTENLTVHGSSGYNTFYNLNQHSNQT